MVLIRTYFNMEQDIQLALSSTSTQITISTPCIVQYINIEPDIHNLHCLYHCSQGDQSSTDLFTHILLGKNKWEPRGTSVQMEFDMFHYVLNIHHKCYVLTVICLHFFSTYMESEAICEHNSILPTLYLRMKLFG